MTGSSDGNAASTELTGGAGFTLVLICRARLIF
jgi:hypothetical protein